MVSIIVPTLNSPPSLVKVLESIQSQEFPTEKLEVIVVLNRSGLPSWSKTLQLVYPLHWLVAPELGVNAARNTGILAARGDILLFLDDDTLLTDSKYLHRLLAIYQSHPQQMSAGGPYLLPEKHNYWQWAYHSITEDWLDSQKISEKYNKTLLGGNASYRRVVFARGLRFTPGIRFGGSEVELNEQVFSSFGPAIYSPKLPVRHKNNLNIFRFIKKAYLQGQGASNIQQRQILLPTAPLIFSQKSVAHKIYNYFFMVGMRTANRQRSTPLLGFIEEAWARLTARLHPYVVELKTIFYQVNNP